MRRLALWTVLGAALLATPTRADAQMAFGVGPRISLEIDDVELAVGAEARIALVRLGERMRLDLRPSFDFYTYGGTFIQISADALLAIDLGNQMIEPYGIAGLTMFYVSAAAISNTEFGFDLGGGARFLTSGRFQPFAELRASFAGFTTILLTGGVLFAF
jgi:hypothetical protein